MSKEKIKPLEAEKPLLKMGEALNEDVLKGVFVDGLGFAVTEHYVALDGVVSMPRSKNPVVVARILVPPEALPAIKKWVEQAIEYCQKTFKMKFPK